MQAPLRKKLEQSIEGKAKWSLNSEINQRLEESFNQRHSLEQYSDGELIDELVRRWGRDRVFVRLGEDKG